MSTLTKNFSFNTNTTLPYTAEGGSWAAGAGNAATTAAINSGIDSTNDTNAGGGVLSMATSGKNKTSSNTWTWTGTWENLGVPAGSTVTALNGNYDWWCTAFNTGSGDNVGTLTLLDGSSVLQATIISGTVSVTGTTAQATRTGTQQSVPAAIQASNSTIKLQIQNVTSTGNSSSGACTIVHDWVALTVTYSAGAQNVAVTGRTSSSSYGSVTAQAGNVNVSVTGRTSTSSYGTVTPSGTGPQTVVVTGRTSSSTYGIVGIRLSVSGRTSTSSYGSVSVATGGVTVQVSGRTSSSSYGSVSIPGGGGGGGDIHDGDRGSHRANIQQTVVHGGFYS